MDENFSLGEAKKDGLSDSTTVSGRIRQSDLTVIVQCSQFHLHFQAADHTVGASLFRVRDLNLSADVQVLNSLMTDRRLALDLSEVTLSVNKKTPSQPLQEFTDLISLSGLPTAAQERQPGLKVIYQSSNVGQVNGTDVLEVSLARARVTLHMPSVATLADFLFPGPLLHRSLPHSLTDTPRRIKVDASVSDICCYYTCTTKHTDASNYAIVFNGESLKATYSFASRAQAATVVIRDDSQTSGLQDQKHMCQASVLLSVSMIDIPNGTAASYDELAAVSRNILLTTTRVTAKYTM